MGVSLVKPGPVAPVSKAAAVTAIIALAVGGFAIGTTEFVTMGLLPDIAEGIDRSIPTTGHIVSAYAFGVVVGAPVIVSMTARLPRKELAIGLILLVGLGNAVTALAGSYPSVLAARFIAGLPHGAYFGVASLLAASMVGHGKKGRAVSGVMLGLSVATVIGVPASTWLGQNLGWRAAYWLVLAITVVAAVMIAYYLPHRERDRHATVGRELTALRKPQVIFAAAAGMVGFGGVFAMYSYIAPTVTDVTDLSRSAVAWFLLLYGIGSVLGSWLAGRLADINVEKTTIGGFIALACSAAAFAAWSPYWLPAAALVLLIGLFGSIIAINLQLRLMDAAGDAQMLGAALNHSSLNIGNGLGAWLGAVVISAGGGYRSASLVGAGLAVAGLIVFIIGLSVQAQSGTSPKRQ